MFKEPKGYGSSPFKSVKYWAVMVGVLTAFIGVFALAGWIADTTGDEWLLMLLCALCDVAALELVLRQKQ